MQKHDSVIFRSPLESIEATLAAAVRETTPNDVILVCGSFFIMADVRKALGIEQEIDP